MGVTVGIALEMRYTLPTMLYQIAAVFASWATLVSSDYTCTLAREAYNKGFHREVETNVTILLQQSATPAAGQCHIVLQQIIPSSMYADLYQLKMLQDMGLPQVYSEIDIDVEKPQHLSPEHTIYIYGQMTRVSTAADSSAELSVTLSIPLHLRYHKPAEDHRQFATATLMPPKIFTRCSDVYTEESQEVPCPSDTSHTCTWTHVPCSASGGGSLEFSVPVGSMRHQTWVIAITVATVLAATVYLTVVILTKDTCSAHPHRD